MSVVGDYILEGLVNTNIQWLDSTGTTSRDGHHGGLALTKHINNLSCLLCPVHIGNKNLAAGAR
jgi:hypothetical protein